ncbi:MAG: hypothetical protein WAK21_14490 [Candidatus Sulfotelmatobacter sp.]
MRTRVISLRLPSAANAALEHYSTKARLSVASGLDCLLQNSFGNCQLLIPLADCPDRLDEKLDIRLPLETVELLKSAACQIRVPVSVYIRKLLYHFYVTKRLRYVPSNGHYTLAGRP